MTEEQPNPEPSIPTQPLTVIGLQNLSEQGWLMQAVPRVQPLFILIDQILACYDLMRKEIMDYATTAQSTGTEMKHEHAVIMQASIASKRELIKSLMSLFRRQRSDSFGHSRRALEYVLFAAHTLEVAGSAELWLRAADSKEDYEKYRKEFRIMNMLELKKYKVLIDEDQPFLGCIIESYEQCCIFVHATIVSAGPFREKKGDSQGFAFLDTPCDLDADELEKTYLWLLQGHMQGARLLERLLRKSGVESSNPEGWKETIAHINHQLFHNFKAIDANPKTALMLHPADNQTGLEH